MIREYNIAVCCLFVFVLNRGDGGVAIAISDGNVANSVVYTFRNSEKGKY